MRLGFGTYQLINLLIIVELYFNIPLYLGPVGSLNGTVLLFNGAVTQTVALL